MSEPTVLDRSDQSVAEQREVTTEYRGSYGDGVDTGRGATLDDLATPLATLREQTPDPTRALARGEDGEAIALGAQALRTANGEDLVPCQAMNFDLASDLVLRAVHAKRA